MKREKTTKQPRINHIEENRTTKNTQFGSVSPFLLSISHHNSTNNGMFTKRCSDLSQFLKKGMTNDVRKKITKVNMENSFCRIGQRKDYRLRMK